MKTKYSNLFAMLAAVLLSLTNAYSQDPNVIWYKDMGITNVIWNLKFVQDGNAILVGGNTYLRKLNAVTGEITKDYGLSGYRFDVADDGNSFYIAKDFAINQYDIETGNLIDSIAIEKPKEYIYEYSDTTMPYKESCLFAPRLIPNSNMVLIVWVARSKNPNKAIYYSFLIIDKVQKIIIKNFGFGKYVELPCLQSSDGRYIVLGQNNGDVELWDAKTLTKIWTLGNYQYSSLAFSPDCSLLAIAGYEPKDINFFDIETRSLIKSFNYDNNAESSDCRNIIFLNNDYILCSGYYGSSSNGISSYRIFKINNSEKIMEFNYFGFGFDFKSNKIALSDNTTAILLNISPDLLTVSEKQKTEYPIIYPNPATNKATIKIPDNLTGTITISIIDIYSKLISNSEEYAATGTKEIDVSTLPVGMYFLIIKSGNYTKTNKLVII